MLPLLYSHPAHTERPKAVLSMLSRMLMYLRFCNIPPEYKYRVYQYCWQEALVPSKVVRSLRQVSAQQQIKWFKLNQLDLLPLKLSQNNFAEQTAATNSWTNGNFNGDARA